MLAGERPAAYRFISGNANKISCIALKLVNSKLSFGRLDAYWFCALHILIERIINRIALCALNLFPFYNNLILLSENLRLANPFNARRGNVIILGYLADVIAEKFKGNGMLADAASHAANLAVGRITAAAEHLN